VRAVTGRRGVRGVRDVRGVREPASPRMRLLGEGGNDPDAEDDICDASGEAIT